MAVPRSSGRYRSRRDDSRIQERLRELAREHPRFGYRRLHLYLHKEMSVNHTRRKHLRRTFEPRPMLTAPCQEWALDFASDVTAAGQRFRVLGVIDSFTRQAHVLETAASFPSRRLTRELERAIAVYGKPQAIRCDNVLTREGQVEGNKRFLSIPYGMETTVTPSGFHMQGRSDRP